MSIPDNPFSTTQNSSSEPSSASSSEARVPQAPSRSPPRLPPLDLPSQNVISHTETQSPSPTYTPGGSVLQHPGEARPTRMDRHVQFNSKHRINSVGMEPLRPPAPSSPQGLSASNLEKIDSALQRHKTKTMQRRRPPRELRNTNRGGEDDDDYDYRLDVDPPMDLGRVTSPSNPSVARETEEGATLQRLLEYRGEDWVPGEYIPLGETDGLPGRQNEQRENQSEATNLVRAHTSKWGTLRRRVKTGGMVHAAFGADERARRGENRPSQERQGGRSEDMRSDQEKSGLGRRKTQRETERAEDWDNNNRQPHLPRRLSGGLQGLPGGGGNSVLSSLLQLYNQTHGGDSEATSAATSAAPSVASSRATSEDEDSSDGDSPKRQKPATHPQGEKKAMGELEKIISPSHGEEGVIRSPLETVASDEIRPEGQTYSPFVPPNTNSSSYVGQNSGQTTPGSTRLLDYFRSAKNEVVEKIEDADRPDAAKSGAGVVGALIASVANVSGVATPAASALVPAARRSGFQLERFSLPEADESPLQAPSRTHWRPASAASTRNNSRPGSVHSSTAVSGATSPEEKSRTRSSSDALVNGEDGSGNASYRKEGRRPKAFDSHGLGKLPGAAISAPGHALKSAEKWIAAKTPLTTPPGEFFGNYMDKPLTEEEKRKRDWDRERRKKHKAKKARKKQEIFIVQHVAAVLARQQFILKLARALMMFGSPSHRLETQIQATARVLEINAQVICLPNVMMISFNDEATHTSETKFLKQSAGIDLGKVLATHNLYWDVIHDRISVDQASKDLDILMTSKVYYNWWQTLIIASTCSAFICVIAYHGSFIDALMSMPLGMLLIAAQMLSARNDLFSNVFEIAIATLISFLAAALASTGKFCYTALVSGGVVLILPGYIVLTGSLELASRNIVSGSVRIGYSVIYSLFLGFGLSIGAEFWTKFTGDAVKGGSQLYCESAHADAPWYRATPSPYWWFLCCPGFSMALALRNQQPLLAKELPIMVAIAASGWCANHFSSLAFPGRADMSSAIGAFVVGTLGSLYGRLARGANFPVTVVGILFQLPSGLANGGIFNFAQESTSGNSNAYSDGFQVAEQLVSVAIGLTVGLFVSAVVTNPLGGSRRTGSGIFSF
ncbi:hypothetical protein BD324DRAFT_648693 [Kockovaella imperatae]|uniref:Threonine/serine exporter-like N-terminal domain-containing protein n=1 Tax=Kockovaella imperatae TaxID=4999 RepID=A0A1Y1URH2_9TREE|nr:hypothetical protein BD324DRAFT_648693 [Kockovaella imperatae]ORX40084.1 hypothetical protein BD324DRAFT_648693 [Kockovaella imperatae]